MLEEGQVEVVVEVDQGCEEVQRHQIDGPCRRMIFIEHQQHFKIQAQQQHRHKFNQHLVKRGRKKQANRDVHFSALLDPFTLSIHNSTLFSPLYTEVEKIITCTNFGAMQRNNILL